MKKKKRCGKKKEEVDKSLKCAWIKKRWILKVQYVCTFGPMDYLPPISEFLRAIFREIN